PGFGAFLDVVPSNPSTTDSAILAMGHGDLDGDGRLDVVVARLGKVTVLRNVGGATMFVAEPEIPCLTTIFGLAIGDYDNDGRLDVATVGTKALAGGLIEPNISVLLNRPDGSPLVHFAAPIDSPLGPAWSSPYSGFAFIPIGMATADFDSDGILDVAVASSSLTGYHPALVATGRGSHGFGTGAFGAPTDYLVFANAMDIAAADFDRDGACDFAVLEYGGNVDVFRGTTGPTGSPLGVFVSGAYVPGPTLPPPFPAGSTMPATALLAVDLDGDGAVDLATTRRGNLVASLGTGLVTYAGNGSFAFGAPVLHVVGSFPSCLAVGDLLASGNLDIAVGREENWIPSNFGLAAIQAGGSVATFPSLTVGGGYPEHVAVADFDGDGASDLVVGKEYGNVTFVPGQCHPAVPRTVTVTSPDGGESIGVDTTETLSWTKSPSVAAVDLAISRDDGATWVTIASNVTATYFDWRVTPPGTSRGRLRVTASGHPSVFDDSGFPFEIAGPEIAAQQVLGMGCPGNGAQIVTALPVLGTSVPTLVFSAPPAALGAVFFSGEVLAPTTLSPGCNVWLDPTLAGLFAFVTDAAGNHLGSFALPDDHTLFGTTFHLQGALWSAAYPTGFGLSSALSLRCGF
ncbi:MAG: VCBS repeat-containing protein, partial [Planctomycetes bacterium]|nr:VCBS repeat-containing protein [Planctomycetota bacterium]